MIKFRQISEFEAAEIANDSEQGRMLVMQRDFLRSLVDAKDEYIACHKNGKQPSDALLLKLERLASILIADENKEKEMDEVWMITYSAYDQSTVNIRLHKHTTGTEITRLHPIAWRQNFLEANPQWEGCNILFAIRGQSV